jgi:ketosteroid isomerase-like protein
MNETNKTVVRKFINALCTGDMETLGTLISQDIVVITTGTSVVSGRRNYQDVLNIGSAFGRISKAGLTSEILNLTAEDDRVACEWEGRCTLLSGKEYNNQYHFLMFIRDGKIHKMKEYMDTKLADAVLAPMLAATG